MNTTTNKKFILGILVITFIMCLSGCGKEKTPSHEWIDATCTTPKTCKICGEIEGTTLEHTWIDASCSTPKTCSVCNKTDGSALGHSWVDASCSAPETCTTCGDTKGNTLDHDLDSTGKCTMCKQQIGFQLNMSNYKQYLNVYFTFDNNAKIPDVTCHVEPVKNVTFKNVTVYFNYQNASSSDDYAYFAGLKSTGYGEASFHAQGKKIGSAKVTAIKGFIIE